jgi:Mitochondrial glycoprotein.
LLNHRKVKAMFVIKSTIATRGTTVHSLDARRLTILASKQLQQQQQIKNLNVLFSSTTTRILGTTTTTRSSSYPSLSNKSSSLFPSNGQSYRFSSNLSSLLQREFIEETETNPIEMPDELSKLKKSLSSKWTIVDGSATDSDGATVKMFRKEPTSNGSKVMLKFHCQDTVQDEQGLLDGMGIEQDEEEEEMSAPLNFELHVSRAGKTMKLACVSEDAQAIVEGVTIVPSDDASASGSADEDDLYRGPILEDLPEDVRDEFDLYVKEECGVDEDVAAFAAMYADYREQAEYVRWLKEVKKIVE